jgi:serine/threonine protein kinase
LPAGVGDTDVSQSGGESDVDAPTLIPQSPSGTRRVGHFELIRVLGQGAFGAVWLAKDLNLGRQVALKLPTRSEKDSGLLREAQTAAKLAHPNIVSVFEVGKVSGQIFIASEFVDGRTLRDELHAGIPKSERAIDVMATIARVAHYAHENGVVHRDMKPANVMVDKQGTPYLTDFGIAKSIAEDETISLDGEVVGTIAYMASPVKVRIY